MSLSINQIYHALAVNGQLNANRSDHCTVDKTGGIKVTLNINGEEREIKLREITYAVKQGLESSDQGEVLKARSIMNHINALKASQHGVLVKIHRMLDSVLVGLHLLADRVTHRIHGHQPIPQAPASRSIIVPQRHMLIEKKVELSTGHASGKFVIEMTRNLGMLQNPSSTLTVYLNQARPKELARETLKAITALDCSRIDTIQIKQEGSRGIDSGGVRRQFFCDLFTDLVTTPPGNAFFDMTSGCAVPKFPKMPPDRKALSFFHDMGKVLALCAQCKIQIGEVFSREVFSIISKMSQDPHFAGNSMRASLSEMADLDPSLTGPFLKYFANLEKLSDDELSAYCHQFPQMDPKGGAGLDRKAKMSLIAQERVKDLQAIYGDDIDPSLSSEAFMEEAKKLLMSDHEVTIKPKVAAIFEVMKVMKTALSPSIMQDGKALGDKILGEPMNAQILASRIQFSMHSAIPVEKQEWIKRSIEKLSQKQVEQFLYYTTGSKGLFPQATITFFHGEGGEKVSTCGRTVTFDSSNYATQAEIEQFILTLANSSDNSFNSV